PSVRVVLSHGLPDRPRHLPCWAGTPGGQRRRTFRLLSFCRRAIADPIGDPRMIFERTHYYAKPGCIEATLATRRKACAVRVEIGLPAGAIRTKSDPTADGPDVSWECEFANEEAHRADLAARAASPAFEAVRAEMRGNIARFERLFERRETVLNGWSGDIGVETINCVPAVHELSSQGRTL